MYPFFFRDNNQGQSLWKNRADCPQESKDAALESLNKIANKPLKDLLDKNPDLLVFPHSFKVHKDGIGNLSIFNLDSAHKLQTNNLMGFVGTDDTKLTIGSRFDADADKQYFMQYMLSKVFAVNLLNLETSAEDENIWDFLLMYIFPVYLNKALNQGLFKTYKEIQYNNANVKGRIDIARHLKRNIPFAGRIAYNSREFSYDNSLTQLIRHTIEYIAAGKHRAALSNNAVSIANIRTVRSATPTYNKRKRISLIQANYKTINHPYFTEYEDLRKICLKILNRQGLSMQNKDNKVHGILFDGAWLWEEYLNTILKPYGFIHPENRTGKNKLHLFANSRCIYPDFYIYEKVVIDAKYKRLSQNGISREDIYQVITYMYRLKSKRGILVYPAKKATEPETFCMHNDSYGYPDGVFKTLSLEIPQNEPDFRTFISKISKNEVNLSETIETP